MRIDLNCDLGENESLDCTEALMRLITSANIACGGHAGNIETMRACIRFALQYGVRIGAHPGLPDQQHFGRLPAQMDPARLSTVILQQVGALETLVRNANAKLHHIKLHGALYHMVEEDAALRDAYLSVLSECWPTAIIFARSGENVVREARARSLPVWPEVFLDRNYFANGELVPRDNANSIITSKDQVAERLNLLRQNQIKALDGTSIAVEFQTLCLHSDSPHAVEFAALAHRFPSN